jgi:hypothetical protein
MKSEPHEPSLVDTLTPDRARWRALKSADDGL